MSQVRLEDSQLQVLRQDMQKLRETMADHGALLQDMQRRGST
jgi:hypothetical protein